MKDDGSSDFELKRILGSIAIPFLFISICFALRLLESMNLFSFVELGIYPRHINGLQGVILAPLIHADWAHFGANSVSFFILASMLFYFYQGVALKAFIHIYLFSGLFVWILGRESWHVGASGLIYGFGSFLFFSGLIRNHIPLMAISLFVIFMYGSMVWGMFPLKVNLPYSWEAHMGGVFFGLFFAILYRNHGPQQPVKIWHDEDDDPSLPNQDDAPHEEAQDRLK